MANGAKTRAKAGVENPAGWGTRQSGTGVIDLRIQGIYSRYK